jgi:hypothetical protein
LQRLSKPSVLESLRLFGFFLSSFLSSFFGLTASTSWLADGKAWTNTRYLDLKGLSWLGTWDEDNEPFVLGYAFTALTGVSDLKVIDFANLYRLRWERSSATAATATATESA